MNSVNDLDLPFSVRNCLSREDIETIDELCVMTADELLGIEGFAFKSLWSVRYALGMIGRALKGERAPTSPTGRGRYGIIPCRRCAFFVPGYPLPNGAVYGGLCARSQKAMDKTVDDGCGDGLLREEAAPLPPEPEQEPKP